MKTCVAALFLFTLTVTLGRELQEFTTGNNIFTASIYRQISARSNGNFLVSPFSAEIALALVQSGAKDSTSEEIRRHLHLPNSKTKTEYAFSRLLPVLKQDQHYSLHNATKIYLKDDFLINDDFRYTASKIYHADIENIDFNRRSHAAQSINQWVQHQTNNKIRDLVDSGSLNERTRAILVSALYFQGNWSSPFKPHLTRKHRFYESASSVVKVDTMTVRSDFKYYESNELRARFLEVPFDGEDASMVIVLPDQIEGLGLLERQIEKVFRPQGFTEETVVLTLPKFKIETKLDFKEILKNLGVRHIFSQQKADLSGIAGRKGDLIVDKVIQKTFIDVNEEGVEAAAATYADTVVPLSGYFPMVPPKEFVVDHPFIFYIKLKDLILFAGKVALPKY